MRFEVHSHTEYSNLRLLDCINKPKKLIDRAIELGLSGIAITDHECISCHPEINIYAEEIKEKYPNFKIALGNEIYLTKDREMGQRYYHFILIAKNKVGHRALRELSSRAWMNSYWDRGMERVPTLYSDIEEIVKKYPNSLIATTACLGGELSVNTLSLITAEKTGDEKGAIEAHNNIVNFMLWGKEQFGEDFYIECAPGCSREQILVNQRLISIANAFDMKMVIGTDAHYLKKEDRYVHKAYLNSKGGEREVDEFYEFAYLQSNDEIKENLKQSNYDEEYIEKMFKNSDVLNILIYIVVICLLVINAEEGVIEQDKHIAGYALEKGKGLILVVNKWDTVENPNIKDYTTMLRNEFQFLRYAPIVFLSALTKKRIHTLMPEVLKVAENIQREVKTSVLNDVINDSYALNLPPSYKGKRLKIYFVHQAGIKPPKFVFQVNHKGLVHFSYERYLENKIRENFDFTGTPIVLQFKNKGDDA